MSAGTIDRGEGRSDADLVGATRAGDRSAFAELWSRHSAAARRAALAITRSIDPDDLVSEAFTKTLGAIRGGGGPTEGFRAYLYTAIRSAAASWGGRQKDIPIEFVDQLPDAGGADHVERLAERAMLVSAFRVLPESHRTVLWYLEVEGMRPRELAPILGLTPNGVSALALRARDGFRQAWLRAHTPAPTRPAPVRDAAEP